MNSEDRGVEARKERVFLEEEKSFVHPPASRWIMKLLKRGLLGREDSNKSLNLKSKKWWKKYQISQPPSRLRDGSSASFCPYLLLWKYVCFPYSVFLSPLFACLVFCFHISCILYEVEGQGWMSCHPGRVFVCGTGRMEVLSRWGFLYQLWNKSCMEAQP